MCTVTFNLVYEKILINQRLENPIIHIMKVNPKGLPTSGFKMD